MNLWSPPTLHTERLVIRPLGVNHLEAVHRYASSQPADRYGSWMGGSDPDSVARYIADTVARYGRPPRCDLGITLDNELVGGIAFLRLWLSPPAMELGWVLNPDGSGLGLAQEALHAVATHVLSTFPKLVRLEARVAMTDGGARRILERLGFQFEGVLRNGAAERKVPIDGALYGLLRGELVQP